MGEIEEFVKGLRKILEGDMTTLKLKRLYTKSGEACARLEQQAKQIKQFEAENRWIPVSERLPKKKEYILSARDTGLASGCCKARPEVWYWTNTNREAERLKAHFTHWKPIILPESGDKKT